MLRAITRNIRLELMAAGEARATMAINGTTATPAGSERCGNILMELMIITWYLVCFLFKFSHNKIVPGNIFARTCATYPVYYIPLIFLVIESPLLPIHQEGALVAIRATARSQQCRGRRELTRGRYDINTQVSDGAQLLPIRTSSSSVTSIHILEACV